jgi:hypothetical protein
VGDGYTVFAFGGVLRIVEGKCYLDNPQRPVPVPMFDNDGMAGHPIRTTAGREIWLDGQRAAIQVHLFDVSGPPAHEEVLYRTATG